MKKKQKKKQLYKRFKRRGSNISTVKTWTWLRKGDLKRESESLLIAAQNNTIRSNHFNARIDKTQQNSRCRLWCDKDETINHIIREYSKLAQKKYKSGNDWVGKVIHRELWKKLRFYHTNKCYMHNPASVLENDTYKLFDIQTDQQVEWTDLIIINNKKRELAKFFSVPADHRIKLKENEKKEKYHDLIRDLKKLWNIKVTIISLVIDAFGTVTEGLLKELGRCLWCNGYRRRNWTRRYEFKSWTRLIT